MLKEINVRFFAYDYFNGELDIAEIGEQTFRELADTGAPISYERHSMFANGCRQVCLTVECDLDGEPV
jgi:hypothetical protein